MNCKRIRKYLPLFIESDLSTGKKKRVQIHLEMCGDCQKEMDAFARSVKTAQEWMEESLVSWRDADWKRTIRNAIPEKTKSSLIFAPWPFKKGWAVALMGAVMIMLIFFVTRPLFLGIEDFRSQTTLVKRQPQHQVGAKVESPQDVVSMTMISKETGLKVVWVLSKNFNLEEKQ
jgi:hypothetical protein